MNAIILAGGNSKRFNKVNKAFIKLGDKTLIDIIINRLETLFNKILIIVKDDEQLHKFTMFTTQNVAVIKDVLPKRSSLSGIYSGLIQSKSYYNFICACDMPFINTDLVRYMINTVKQGNADVVIPRLKLENLPNKGYEVLHSIYSKKCIHHIERQIKNNNFKIIDFFLYVKVKEIPEEVIKEIDPQLLSFFNINNINDLRKASRILHKKEDLNYATDTIRYRNSTEY
ncbi:MAG: molybdenum cofactor guanylyltransferase [Endomicrobia bacterium]|nr:molybdenum cofactor guanylyltransferase [Endomicrobiia bacterium]MDW8056285.1 molybdenum cofactor guanylyltransferase [Elusimicrobiota bacterium]